MSSEEEATITEEEERISRLRDEALELGFTEAEVDQMMTAGVDATNMRRMAKGKFGETDETVTPALGSRLGDAIAAKVDAKVTETEPTALANKQGDTKPHKHSYRKNGTCACGAVRRAKKS